MGQKQPRIKWTTLPRGLQIGIDEATGAIFSMRGTRLTIDFHGVFLDRYGKAVAEAFLDALHATPKE
jgi:hypothetical protein|nr:MAG TPA: hypothetical protein [Caudoviricetes sp.]